MEEKHDRVTEENSQEVRRDISAGGIGTGKKTGLYGCGLLILAIAIIFIVLVLTGTYNPFQGTEGVGP